MGTLLKDMPEHMERIEYSYLLTEEIKDELKTVEIDTDLATDIEDNIIGDIVDALKDAEFAIDGATISLSNKQELAQTIYKSFINCIEGEWLSVCNPGDIAVKIREKLTDFVNQNYEWKGVKK